MCTVHIISIIIIIINLIHSKYCIGFVFGCATLSSSYRTARVQGVFNVAAVPPLRMPPPTAGGINEPQECPYCRRTFSCYYSLKRHFQDKHEQSDTLYVCEFCHRRYRTKNSLTTHKSLQHRGSSGMLKRLLKTSALHSALAPAPHHLFDLGSEHAPQLPPGLQWPQTMAWIGGYTPYQ